MTATDTLTSQASQQLDLTSIVLRQSREVCALKERFFSEQASTIADCCRAMAKRFDQGGRLFAMGNGGSSCDTIHFSVEFMHPIIEKRPPLPPSTPPSR